MIQRYTRGTAHEPPEITTRRELSDPLRENTKDVTPVSEKSKRYPPATPSAWRLSLLGASKEVVAKGASS